MKWIKIFGSSIIVVASLIFFGCLCYEKGAHSVEPCQVPVIKEEKEESLLLSLLPITKVFQGKDYTFFDENDIAYFVARMLLMNKQEATDIEIQKLVKNYFGKENYALKEGTYTVNNEKFNIEKKNSKYTSNLYGKELLYTTVIQKMEQEIGKSITLKGKYIHYINPEQNQYETLALVTYYFEYQPKYQKYIIKNVIYQEGETNGDKDN